ncbi:MAG: ribonuclease P [Candidatus Aenigmarchaeota archaeon]|nr:ribonuclease P [Candidatus Aenigmarchaeota archaeon]
MIKTTRNNRRTKPDYQIKLAKERIDILAKEAEKAHAENPKMARRYYKLAKKIGMRYNVKIPTVVKRKFCKWCFSFLSEGWRLKKGVMRNTCKTCGKHIRYPYKPMRHK